MDSPFTILKSDLRPRSPTRQVMCRYDITLIYEGETNTCGNGLQRAAISARVLLDGKTLQDVEQSKVIVNEGPTSRIRWKLGGYFATQPTLSSFAIYVSLKSPKQEQTILEAKFHQQFIQALQGGYTWDIVASKFLDDGFSLSLETHHFHPSYERVDIFHETKTGTTFLHMNSLSDDRDASPEREKQLVRNLLDLPSSETRAIMLLINGFHLISRHQHSSNVTYHDLAIQAISAACAHSQSIRRQSEAKLCQSLFFQCTQPDGHLFLDKAMDVLKGLDSVSLAEAAMQEIALLCCIVHVLQEQNRSDYTAIALPVLIPSLRALAMGYRTNKIAAAVLRQALVLSISSGWGMKETLSILDLNLPVTALHHPEEHVAYLMIRADNYIDHYERGGELDCDSVVTAIGDFQTHLLRYGLGKPKHLEAHTLLLRSFAKACKFLTPVRQSSWGDLGFLGPGTMISAFCILAVAYGQEGPHKVKMKMALMMFLMLFMEFRHAARPAQRPLVAQNTKKFIQAIYAEHVALNDSDIDFLKELLLHQVEVTLVKPSTAPQPRILAAIKYSLSSTEPPRDELALMRVMVAAPAARLYDLPITLRAYQLLMAAHEMWAPIYVPLHQRQTTYRFGTFMVHDAISYVLGLGYYDLALEWADQSSSIAWRQVIHLHSSFQQVASVNIKVAEELAEAASQILDLQTRSDYMFSDWANRWEDAIKKARKLPGLDRFSRHKTPSEIRSAVDALGGPVVYFNINRYSCDALCVLPNLDDVVHIPLPGLKASLLRAIANLFFNLLNGTGTQEVQVLRLGKLVKVSNEFKPEQFCVSLSSILKFLWDQVVKPILDGLAIQRSESESADKLPRIWWCPSGELSLLPLHAAGYYDNPTDDNISDYVVSSYIPSASIISQITRAEDTLSPFQLLAVANPEGCGLPGTLRDLDIVRKHAVHRALIELVGKGATPGAVKQELKTATWAHFACHGVQTQGRSSLILANHTRLTLSDIIKLSIPQAQLAFLAACQTSKEDFLCCGESAHLAGGMLVAGFRGVVSTMWNISDYYAPDFADRFYQKMFERGGVPDYKRAAYALHDAVKTLRREKNLDFRIWVPFVHSGA